MARKVRIFVANNSQHVILKSLHNFLLFNDDEDYEAFKGILNELVVRYAVAIHAYILVERHFEFLLTPQGEDTLSKFMQSLGRKYVAYFNKKYQRTGTVFEGRYKASLVEDAVYLLDVMLFIEQQKGKQYKYSSIQANCLGYDDSLVHPHREYLSLAKSKKERQEAYCKLYKEALPAQKHSFIGECLEKQYITGTKAFIRKIEQIVGLSLERRGRGRPPKIEQNKGKKMYKNLVVLDKEKHKELKISPLENLNFAKQAPFIPIIAAEAKYIGKTFPVVFTSDAEPTLVALVSLGGENLAINQEGKWITPYIPAYLRKYPFALASTGKNSESKVILIDEDAPVFSKTKGKQLFKKNGEKSDTLSHAVDFLVNFEKDMQITKNVAKLLNESGILEDREISVGENEEKKVLVNGFKVVNREKLNALSDAVLAEWVRKGIMKLIDEHLDSLDNIETLFTLAQQRQ